MTGIPASAADADRLRLASPTAGGGPGGEFVLRLNASAAAAPDDVELAVAVHPVVANRTAFAQTLDDRVRGTPITVTTSLLSELSPDEGGAVVVRLPVDDLDRATPADR